jgi:hypothetical protein
MPSHFVMTPEDGDKPFHFDESDPAQVKEAMERFNDLVGRQKMWASTPGTDGRPKRQLKQFEPDANVIFMRQVTGG